MKYVAFDSKELDSQIESLRGCIFVSYKDNDHISGLISSNGDTWYIYRTFDKPVFFPEKFSNLKQFINFLNGEGYNFFIS